ncbi:MAG TPA: hypothetical protein VJ770_19300 [Stellaceae bacterium]|nr:hypothetical protein [Stellaceae bacterium]
MPGNETRIRRNGNAAIPEPLSEDWAWLNALIGKVDDDFARAVKEQPEPQQRPALDEVFTSPRR